MLLIVIINVGKTIGSMINNTVFSSEYNFCYITKLFLHLNNIIEVLETKRACAFVEYFSKRKGENIIR